MMEQTNSQTVKTMRLYDLPEHWKTIIEERSLKRSGGRYREGACDFPAGSLVFLRFPDGSTASFRYAFVIHDAERNELGLFTEHCGYHVFSAIDLEWSELRETAQDSDGVSQ